MSTFTYDSLANAQWSPSGAALGGIDVLADVITALAIDITAYTAAPADASLADIPGAAILGTVVLTSVAVTARGFTSDPVNFGAIPAGPNVTALVIYKDTGTPGTSPLMLFLDDASAGLPATPDGVNDVIANPGPGGWAVL